MSLSDYWKKRNFQKTPEPAGIVNKNIQGELSFVVQKHHATHLHYDFRLELDGVLKSWAIPKGPSMDPEIKRFAAIVEDHPVEYKTFEGIIPKGNYGAGNVIVWDEGTYIPVTGSYDELLNGINKGKLSFILKGSKLKGEFALVKLHSEDKGWILIKKDDAFATSEDITVNALSIKTGRDVEEFDSTKRSEVKTKKSSMPESIKPMLATNTTKAFNDPNYIFEIKWDGYRAICQIKDQQIRLYSRNNNEFTNDYPSIVSEARKIEHDVVLDGEVVVLDEKGHSRFQLLQNYKPQNPGKLMYYVFDLLYFDGYDIRDQPLIERKNLLKSLLPESSIILYSDHIEGKGEEFFTLAQKKKLEGIIAKKKDGPYLSSRSTDWQKIKSTTMTEAIICGYTEPQGSRHFFGSLLLGTYKDGVLTYIGHTGSGFTSDSLSNLLKQVQPLITHSAPFTITPKTNAKATWLKPVLVCQVKYAELTEGGMLRQAIFLGLRDDKKAEDVAPEVETAISESSVRISHGDKIYFPDDKLTKQDVVDYYKKVASIMMPYLQDRLHSLNRYPNGITGENFYHKDIVDAPDYVKTIAIPRDDGKVIHYLLCDSKETLLYMVNLGCIEINPWSSRVKSLDKPDYVIIDLDPNDISFSEAIRVAHCVKEVLDNAFIDSFIKTSGKRGLHILIPLGRKYSFEQTRLFAEILANVIHKQIPDITSIVRDPKKRQKKVYIDFLQNRAGQTIAAPYSLRPVKGAHVSTPLEWPEVTEALLPDQFTIKTIFDRIEKKKDVWKALLRHDGIDMMKSLATLEKI